MNVTEKKKVYSLRWAVQTAMDNPKRQKKMNEYCMGVLNDLLGGPLNPRKEPNPNPRAPRKSPVDGKVVFIVGHTDKSSGAWCNYLGSKGMAEYDFWNKVAKHTKKYAENNNIPFEIVYRDRIGIWKAGQLATKIAGKNGAVVELHFNWTPGARGSEVLYDTRQPKNKVFSKKINDFMVKFLKTKNRGVKKTDTGRGAGNLKAVETTGCLIEPFFAQDEEQARFIYANYKKFGEGLLKTAQDFISR